MLAIALLLMIITDSPALVNAQYTIFDHLWLKNLRVGREQLFKFAGATGENAADFRTNLRNNVST